MILELVIMAPFLRISFNSYDLGVLPPLADPPFCAIKMKEALTTGENIFTITCSFIYRSYYLLMFSALDNNKNILPLSVHLRARQDLGSAETYHVPSLEVQF